MKNPDKISCHDCSFRHNSVFSELDDQDLVCLEAHKAIHHYKKGQYIFRESNKPLGLYCLNKGKVKIFKTSSNGNEQIVRFAKPCDLLGYRSFLSDENYYASAVALEDCDVCFIDKNDFFRVLKNNEKLSMNLIRILSHELRDAENLLRDMAQKTVRERVAEVLLLLKQKFGYEEGGTTLNVQLSRDELASFVGTATESLIRVLSDFKSENIINTKGKKIQIIDFNLLIKTANLDN